jgi:hypothetical protein
VASCTNFLLGVVEAFSCECVKEVARSLEGKRLVVLEGSRGEGEAAVLQHELGHVVVVGVSGDAEVLQHGVRFPAPKQLDDVGVDACTQEGGGAAWTEAAGTDESWVDSCVDLQVRGSQAKGSGDGGRPNPRRGCAELGEVGVDRSVGRCVVAAEPVADASKCLARAQEGVGTGSMADLFTTNGVLLVVKREGGSQDATNV